MTTKASVLYGGKHKSLIFLFLKGSLILKKLIHIPSIGDISVNSGMTVLDRCSDRLHETGKNGVVSVVATGDRKVEFIGFEKSCIAYVNSSMGYPAYYPVHPLEDSRDIKAVSTCRFSYNRFCWW